MNRKRLSVLAAALTLTAALAACGVAGHSGGAVPPTIITTPPTPTPDPPTRRPTPDPPTPTPPPVPTPAPTRTQTLLDYVPSDFAASCQGPAQSWPVGAAANAWNESLTCEADALTWDYYRYPNAAATLRAFDEMAVTIDIDTGTDIPLTPGDCSTGTNGALTTWRTRGVTQGELACPAEVNRGLDGDLVWDDARTHIIAVIVNPILAPSSAYGFWMQYASSIT
jgi:hypothetical protein